MMALMRKTMVQRKHTIPRELDEWVERRAAVEDRSRSSIVREALYKEKQRRERGTR